MRVMQRASMHEKIVKDGNCVLFAALAMALVWYGLGLGLGVLIYWAVFLINEARARVL